MCLCVCLCLRVSLCAPLPACVSRLCVAHTLCCPEQVLGEYVMGGGNKKGLAGLLKLLRGVAGATKLPQQPSIAERSTGRTMGYHADLMAEINGVERPEQDAWAIDSHNKACAARSAGLLAEEIVAVAGADGELVEDDELIREGMTTQQLAKLKGVFRDQGARAADESAGVDGSGAGTVTAASSSALTDGASAVGKSSSNP